MPRGAIFTIFIVIELLIVGVVVWCAMRKVPAGKFLVPAMVLFVLNGTWLIVATLRNTPRR
jgi:hypothetical protein